VESLQRGVAAALEKTGFGALAIHSGSPVKRTEADDAYWSLRPTPHFQHWLPLAEPGGLLVVQPGKQPKLVRTLQPSFWEAPGHEQLRTLFASGDRAELELHLAFLGTTLQDDAETPYKNIVALGKHAATLHHISYEKRAAPAQSLLLDAGASFSGYCSDITR